MPFDPNTATPDFDPSTAASEGAVVQPDGTLTLPSASYPSDPKPLPAPQADTGFGFETGVKIPLDNASLALEEGARHLGIPVDKINDWWTKLTGQAQGGAAGVRRADLDYIKKQIAAGRKPGMMGNIAGNILTTGGLALATRNPWLLGAAQGALSTEAETPGGAMADTAFGAGFGKAGDIVGKGIAAIASPIWRKMVTQLANEGVELTPGQITGGGLHRVEDAAMSFPIIGDFVRGASDRAKNTFNTAAANRALEALGEVVPKGLKAGHDTIRYVQDRLSDVYNEVFSKARLNYDVDLRGKLKALIADAESELPDDHFRSFAAVIQKRFIDAFSRKATVAPSGAIAQRIGTSVPGAQGFQSGSIPGIDFKELESELNAEARAFMPRGGFDSKYAGFINKLKDTLHSALTRQNPSIEAKLDAADQGYAALARLETAAAPAKGGIVSAEQLHNAAVAGDRTVRHRAAARGEALMQDLATAGREVVSRTVPDSGTITRGVINAGVAAALYDRAPQVALNPWVLGGLGAAVSPYTKVGGKIVRSLMLGRQGPTARAARGAVDAARPIGTIGSAAAALYQRNQRGRYRQNGTDVEYQAPGTSNWVKVPK